LLDKVAKQFCEVFFGRVKEVFLFFRKEKAIYCEAMQAFLSYLWVGEHFALDKLKENNKSKV